MGMEQRIQQTLCRDSEHLEMVMRELVSLMSNRRQHETSKKTISTHWCGPETVGGFDDADNFCLGSVELRSDAAWKLLSTFTV